MMFIHVRDGHSRRFGCQPVLPVYSDEQTFAVSDGLSQTGQQWKSAARMQRAAAGPSNQK
jgi:hypothetical protein